MNEAMISFSIVTVTYNAESAINRTVESVFAQTYSNIEHLIIDGASSDKTLSMVNEYVQRSQVAHNKHEIKVISEPDKGLYDAMNKGIRMATGDYLIFLNAGDTFPSECALEDIAKSVVKEGVLPGVLYGDTDIVDKEGVFLCHRRLSPPKTLTWRSFKRGMLVCHQAFYARTDLAKNNFYNLDYRYSADVDWCIRVMKEAEKKRLSLLYVNAVIVNFLDGGMTTKNHRDSLKERFQVMRKHYGLFTTLVMHGWFIFRSFLNK